MSLLMVIGHANPESLTVALARAYEEGARSAGLTPERLELAELTFDPVLRSGYRAEQTLEPDLVRAQAALRSARHVAWFFPMWWGAPPALVKAFVDRTFLPGFAFRFEAGRALQHKLLAGRSARLVTTMDAPWWWYALFYRRALHHAFLAATLRFVGFGPVATLTGYNLRASSPRARERLLERCRRAGRSDARKAVRARAQPAQGVWSEPR